MDFIRVDSSKVHDLGQSSMSYTVILRDQPDETCGHAHRTLYAAIGCFDHGGDEFSDDLRWGKPANMVIKDNQIGQLVSKE